MPTATSTAVPSVVISAPVAPTPIQSQLNEKYSKLLETAKIAIVDDEEMNIEVVQGYLETEGYRNFFRTTDATRENDEN